jgi:hypothetical protein
MKEAFVRAFGGTAVATPEDDLFAALR